jgi:hypothetical protein
VRSIFTKSASSFSGFSAGGPCEKTRIAPNRVF